MSRHEGVSCDSCLKGNFRGRRYKCLICYDYDLCATCYESGATTTRHTTDHPMQCILTRSDYELYYGGEGLTVEQPQAFTCPFCGKQGLTEATLQEHVAAEHADITFEVVCPVCASLPGGDPNHVTDDFAAHLTLEHRSGPRDLISFLDEPSVSRHGGVRRIPHSSRGGSGVPRARRSNMHFSSSGGLSALSPSSRDVDPIAELLSQLSGVRRSAAAASSMANANGSSSSVGSTPSQLQQLQMQLQLERQQAARQQLERLPRRSQAASNGATVGLAVNPLTVLGGSMAGLTATNQAATSGGDQTCVASQTSTSQSNSQYILGRSSECQISEEELHSMEETRAEHSLFVQELLLSSLADVSLHDCPAGAASLPLLAHLEQQQQQQEARPSGPQPPPHAQPPHHQQPSASKSRSLEPARGPQPHHQQHMQKQQQKPVVRSAAKQAPPPMCILPTQPPVMMVTGTGTIREVPPQSAARNPASSGAGLGSQASSVRRKPIRQSDPRNQPTDPPPR
ncbi:E3 ubiquitin-protein ligase KCMF1-like isoform X2 [Neocloeon triangulifer]|uniref:E3 ubiquitin-protein ligase KCMF1-like isoform X2 n=1 Tax=Neocloeon triangulifer TaxID=2078957 RepID=UPI00286F0D8B|nr:E3 ubiquitin-protein ligase KCMF1-like isoform X2 [Neocloeon triangulifer]